MTIAIIAATQPITVALALWLVLRHLAAKDRELTRNIDRLAALADPHAIVTRLVETVERERDARRDEIQGLLQRIQAPKRAVIQHIDDRTPPSNPWPLSEAETVEAQDERLQALAAIERLEREEAGSLVP